MQNRLRVQFGLFIGLLAAGLVHAQTPTTFQLFLPGGRLPAREVRIAVQAGMRVKRSISTDAKGAFQLPSDLLETFRVTLRIESDGVSFADATIQILPNRKATLVPIFLPPLPATSQPGTPTAAPLGKDVPDVDYFDARAPAGAQTSRDAALKASRENDPEKTIALFAQSLIQYPEYLRAINEMGLFYYQQNRLEEAGFAFTYAASIRSRFPYPRLNLAQTRMRQGNGGDAQFVLRALLIDFPDFTAGRVAYADLLMRGKQFDEAATEYKLLAGDPKLDAVKRADARMNLGLIAHREERYNGAVREFTRALADSGDWPNKAQTHLYLGNALQSLQKTDDAEREYLKAYELGGSRLTIAQALLGQLYFEQQKYDLALRAFEQVLKDAPNGADTPKIVEQIEKVRAAMKK